MGIPIFHGRERGNIIKKLLEFRFYNRIFYIKYIIIMGCWDVFCFICGNPCHSMIVDYQYLNEEIKSSYSKYSKDLIKKLQTRKNIVEELKELSKEVKWMDKCSMLLENDKVIHGVKEINGNVTFCKNSKCYEHISLSLDNYDKIPNGFFIHTDCWKYIKKNYNISLKFSNLPPYSLTYSKIFKIDYGDIEKYWEQDFNFPEVVFDKKKYLCSSPLNNDKNISQIKKNISKLKLKNEPERKGPMISATFYKEGDIKIGNNKRFWVIKGNKWVEINEKPIKMKIKVDLNELDKKQQKFVESIPYIGQFNKEPIFLVAVKTTKSNVKPKRVSKKVGPINLLSSNIELEVILLESFKNKLIIN